jgi:hypothetical protein
LAAEGDHRDDRMLAGLRLAQSNGDAETSARAQDAAAGRGRGDATDPRALRSLG